MKESSLFGIFAAGIGMFLVFYFLMGIRAQGVQDGGRIRGIYLFAPWYLYSRILQEEQRRFTLLVHRLGDRVFEPPVFAEQINEARGSHSE